VVPKPLVFSRVRWVRLEMIVEVSYPRSDAGWAGVGTGGAYVRRESPSLPSSSAEKFCADPAAAAPGRVSVDPS